MLNAPLRDKDGDIFLIFLRKPLGKQGPVLIKRPLDVMISLGGRCSS